MNQTPQLPVLPAHPGSIDANLLFESEAHRAFPVCTQVTLNHGICDSRCLSCPIGRLNYGDATAEVRAEFTPASRRHMPFEIFARVADEVARHPHAWLRLHARGEPLLHPRFVELVRYAKRAGVRLVQAFTDAITLDETKARAVLEAGLDVLECSIHGHEQTYESLMRNGKFERVRENVIRFRRLRDELGASTRLIVSAVDQPEFQTEKEAHRAFWSQHADEVIYRPHHSWGNRVDGVCGAVPETRHACSQLWTRCTIGPTGKALACFNSWSEVDEEVLGDLNEPGTTIAAIWRSERLDRIRQDHASGDYSLPCCRNCRDWTGSAWGQNSYEHLLRVKLGLEGSHAGADHPDTPAPTGH
ncbi:MAG: radical SAM/SPASM domain-containing protein [Blastocatellia bacterium]